MLTARRFLFVCALLAALVTRSSSQTRPTTETPADAAVRALNTGQYEQVETLLAGATDARAVVLRARANRERGRYQQAEALLAPAAASAPGGDAALELGMLQRYLGRPEARRTLERVVQTSGQSTAADFVRLGNAARALGEFQQANSDFRQASQRAPNDVEMNTAWGELFLEKYNRTEALKSFQAAVAAAPQDLRARLDLARVLVDDNPAAAKKLVDEVLTTNPRSVPAHLLSAELALDERRRDDARASIRKALDVNPSSLEALALDGAIAAVEDRTADFNARVADALKIHPSYGEAYRVAGEHLARNYRFEEAVAVTRRAVMLDPTSTRANSDLGLHLLRTGDEPGARRALETAFKADPYDVVTYNLLSLLDTLDKFQTITDGDIVMRFHADEAAVMKEYALPLAKQALATLSKAYQFTPTGPILIEMFPKHDDFAVRTLGLPGMIGALGACFGKVVTLDSPRARPPGQFSWEATLWHELAHVITLQMSNNRVPRWLTEGLSEWEEKRARPEWGREMEVSFAQAMDAKKVLKVKDLNDGFSNPQLISLTYFEASLLVEHLAATYGEPAIWKLLRAYGRGLETEAALKDAFNATVDDIQTSFDAKLERDFGAMRRALKSPDIPEGASLEILRAAVNANPDSFALRMRLAAALQEMKDSAGAIRELEKAAELVPRATGADNPNRMIAQIALQQKDTARAVKALEALLAVDSDDVESARLLARTVAPLNDANRTAAAYQKVVELDPFDTNAQTMVGRHAVQTRDGERALRAFRAALATSPADPAAAHVDLGEAYLLTGDKAEAKKEALAALEIAPSFERAQDLLLKLVGG